MKPCFVNPVNLPILKKSVYENVGEHSTIFSNQYVMFWHEVQQLVSKGTAALLSSSMMGNTQFGT